MYQRIVTEVACRDNYSDICADMTATEAQMALLATATAAHSTKTCLSNSQLLMSSILFMRYALFHREFTLDFCVLFFKCLVFFAPIQPHTSTLSLTTMHVCVHANVSVFV